MQRHPEAWTLTDGRAGNARQAQALAAAMGLQARDWVLAARAPWRWASPRRMPGSDLAFGRDFAHALPESPHLAIGCGRQAALATRLLRARGSRAVQILDPRIATRHWDLVIAPEHDELRGENVITLLGSLHPVDDLWLAAARHSFPTLADLPRPRTTVLIGGPSAHTDFDDDAFARLLEWLRVQLERDGGSLLATVSRRTPPHAGALLRARLDYLPGLIWCGEPEVPNPYAGLLGWADRIVCTADSVNMLSEAAATNVPVFVSGMEGIGGRPRRFIDSLVASGRVQPCLDALDPFPATPPPVTPLRETARVAAEVRARLRE